MNGSCGTITGISDILCQIQNIFNYLIPILITLGVVYFVWGVVRYVIADGEEAKTKGRDSMIFGIIGLAVIVSMWGLVNIITSTFDLGKDSETNKAPSADELQKLLPQ